jgi:hypothetical protein
MLFWALSHNPQPLLSSQIIGYDKVRMPRPAFVADMLRVETEIVKIAAPGRDLKLEAGRSIIRPQVSRIRWSAQSPVSLLTPRSR